MPLLAINEEESDEEFMTLIKRIWESEVFLVQGIQWISEEGSFGKIKEFYKNQENKNLWMKNHYAFEDIFFVDNQFNFSFWIDEHSLNC